MINELIISVTFILDRAS